MEARQRRSSLRRRWRRLPAAAAVFLWAPPTAVPRCRRALPSLSCSGSCRPPRGRRNPLMLIAPEADATRTQQRRRRRAELARPGRRARGAWAQGKRGPGT
eukprot:9086117-Pyramimonas_sp.AAC.1